MKNWKYIIIHHSTTEDGKFLNDFKAIERFHTSYRYNDDIVTKEKAEELMRAHKFITLPWKKIGYQKVIEYDNNILVVKDGRTLDESGAHCKGLNSRAIGICLVGDFDKKEPVEEQYDKLVEVIIPLIKQLNIKLSDIRPHSYFASWKSCPGHKFNWTKFIIKIQRGLQNGTDIK